MATILIVDERAANRRCLGMVLARMGHRVVETGSGVEAMAAIGAVRPDLLLLDILGSPPGGYQLVRELRAQPALMPARVVFLAARHMESEARLLARASGIGNLVVASTDTVALRNIVADVLARPGMPPDPDAPKAGESEELYPVVSQLCGRVTELELCAVHLERHSAARGAQLEIARAALDREVGKRRKIELDMTQESQRLRTQAVRDPLTGLYNRRYLEESLAREESRAKRSGRPLSMMMIDIDHFKRYNDMFGHAAGDAVLRAVSHRMESLARSEDILCRYGGEEFVLLMTDTAAATLRQRADMLHADVPQLRVQHDQHAIGPITLSIGLAIFPEHGNSAQAVLQVADAALYQAKTLGRDRVVQASASSP